MSASSRRGGAHDEHPDAEGDDLESTLVSAGRRSSEPERLVARLADLGWSIAAAESLTGGLLAASIVSVSGASRVFRGGIVAYATDVKASLLGVEQHLLDAHGPVHPRVASQMAEGVRRALGRDGVPADVGVATTGIAGPLSPDGQPVGTVHIAVATPLGSRVESVLIDGDRAAIRTETAARAVRLVLDTL
ncbi:MULTISPECIES: CinA family protein [Microbacterium]|uniref:Damage-inducible protein CinA n=1 Tax=Microbacterium hominis TaxID=162426 RepID=A0A0B4DQD2_9MICO|nr:MULTISPECIES: CinA family protein [Microbacterium]MDC7803129.1 CinA family protein [Sphingomonas sp. BLCC-B65]AXA97522.1 CinA family protein [Microbacterium sp. PM5]EXJ52022.1 competence protein [Microbacterium sp. MRS-1]KIC56463.1 damage-inducible protein CinA [Microbacterium hominis]ODT24441.1 MAG: damage-inducible protein CinA [Microbacterium sp. SCN 69-37]